jgi:hypothetical protein
VRRGGRARATRTLALAMMPGDCGYALAVILKRRGAARTGRRTRATRTRARTAAARMSLGARVRSRCHYGAVSASELVAGRSAAGIR